MFMHPHLKCAQRRLRTHVGLSISERSTDGLERVLSKTDASGHIGATANHKFGPYVLGGVMPVNPLDEKNTVSAAAVFPPTAVTAAGGWLYHEATGPIAINHADHFLK